MLKKFVPLNANASPSLNPYEVRTYMGDNVKTPEWKVDVCGPRKCEAAQTSTISKVLTIEDELRMLHKKAKESRFYRVFKKKCQRYDEFELCVVPQRSPKELKTHAVMRERYIRTQQDLNKRTHNADLKPILGIDLVQLNSPLQMQEAEEASEEEFDEGEEEDEVKEVKPKLASPECSLNVIYKPPQRMLELKRPKSGMFHNETEPPFLTEDELEYGKYNPRRLQEEFDAQNLQSIDIIEGNYPNDLWTWNIGMQRDKTQLDNTLIEATIPELDCKNIELTVFKIPNDLQKHFAMEVVFGNLAVLPEPPRRRPSYYNRPKEVACLFVAYVESYRLSASLWTSETMDAMLSLADKLLRRSTNLNYKSTDMDFDIIPQIPERQAAVCLKVHFTNPLKCEPNIYKALSLYFSKYNAAILCSKKLYLLIWKCCANSFYVFDPNGRDEYCQRDFEYGKCTLLLVNYVENLVHLIISYSATNMDDEYNLYEIFLSSYGKITNPLPNKAFPKHTRKLWAVVNETYAIIPAGNNGLQQPLTGTSFNGSMIISLLALLYGNIEKASLWRTEVMDDLIKLGQVYYKTFIKRQRLKKKEQLNITDLPDMIMMGVFRATLTKKPFFCTGHLIECKNFSHSLLTLALRDLFNSEWEAGLLQVDNSVLALWRDQEYFYVFDPFRRGRAGQVLDPEDYLTKGMACLQLHMTFESLCRILYQKALGMRRGGKFFLHGINVGCIKPLQNSTGHKSRFPRLQLTYPSFGESGDAKPSKKKKSKKGKLDRVASIHSVPSLDRIPDYAEEEVVEGLLEEVICEIIFGMLEPAPSRSQLYKCAEKVLLQSDKPYLEALKYKLMHGQDYENYNTAFQTSPEPPTQPISLEEEILIPSNYEKLPDGTWIILGTSQLPLVDDEISKLAGLLACLVTAALVSKYKISTWNSKLIEFALESANSFGDDYKSYENTLGLVLAKNLPKILIGDSLFMFQIQKIMKSSMKVSLRQLLLKSLLKYSRILLICQRFSCVIVKRYNFLYMFIGFPCNNIGYRKFGAGPGCMLRFIELDSLIRRIEFGCNPQGCEVTNYVAVAMKVADITKETPDTFRQLSESEENAYYTSELAKHRKSECERMNKIRFLDDELRKENARINQFIQEKAKRVQPKSGIRKCPKSRGDVTFEDDDEWLDYLEGEEGEEAEEEEECDVELKHKPGKRMKKEVLDRYRPSPIVYGYRMREKDCLFKIQGSTCLEGREESFLKEIKPCYFVSTLAVLFAVLRPLSQWGTRRVDRVVEDGNAIASNVHNRSSRYQSTINKVTVDDYEFDVWIKTFEPAGVRGLSIKHKIKKAMQTRHYMLLQTCNCTYALYHDEYYHLFDPYGSMEVIQDEEEEEEDTVEDDGEGGKKKKKKCPKGIQRYGERNTASWVLFAEIEQLIKYIDKRCTNPNWKECKEFMFHVVDVLSYKKAAPSKRILQLLTDLSVPMECKITQHGEDESTICAHNETLSWLELENCLPVWSRMNRRNTAGRYRNLPVSKLKKFDIEIDGRLWSLWGSLHPHAPVFDAVSRGKQYLACYVVACCAARVYSLMDWSAHLLDTIVISGDRYHRESLANIKQEDYEFSLEDLNLECTLENIKFVVHLEHVAYGVLYATPTRTRMNLADGLMYFFGHFQFGILQCYNRSLAIGRTLGHDGGYFMFDCQSRDLPLFPKGQGASYLLRTKHLQVLLYCIVVSLNVPYFNMQFTLHKVEMLRDGAEVEPSEEFEGEDEEDN